MIKTVIILGNHIQSLGVIQCAGKLGLNTVLFNNHKICVAAFSRYCKKFVVYENTNDLKKKLVDSFTGTKEAVIIPTNDLLVEFLATNYDTLNQLYYLAIPKKPTADICLSKILTYKAAADSGILLIDFATPGNIEEALSSASSMGYPVVLRPAFMHRFFPGTGKKILFCKDQESLLEQYRFMTNKIPAEEVIVQKYVPEQHKKLFSFCSFFADGTVYGSFILHRMRQRPGEFGISTFAKTVVIDEIENLSVKFLKRIDYFGISEIEYIYDERTKEYKIIEINPRTWKQHSVTERLGINLIGMLIDYFNGNKINVKINQKIDVGWIEPITDIFAVMEGIRKGKLNFRQYINTLMIEKKIAVFSSDDIVPALMYVLLLPYLFGERR